MKDPKPFANIPGVKYPEGIQQVAKCEPLEPAPQSLAVQTVASTVPNVELTAENADEMAVAQKSLIGWCKAKVQEQTQQHNELRGAYKHARKCKWKFDTLERHANLAAKRLDFYQRILIALEHGYQIVPSFPITAFAVRTDRKKPLRMWTTSWLKKHTQEAKGLPQGEGDYKNPFPIVQQRTLSNATATESEKVEYFATDWKDLEFPVSMAKPEIMEATTRAMALKIFDEIGILPGYSPEEGTRAPRGDPIIIARLKLPRHPGGYGATDRWVAFIIAWHLDTRSL